MSAADSQATASSFPTAIAALLDAGDWAGVAARADAALAAGDASGWPQAARAAAAFRTGALGRAVTLMRDLVGSGRAPSGSRDVLAVLYCLAGDLAQALEVGADPDGAQGIGLVRLFGDGLPPFADAVAAIVHKPLLRQGRVALESGEPDRARFLITQHLLVDGADPEALEPLAAALSALGRVDQAVAVLRALIAQEGPSPVLLSRLARDVMRQGDGAQSLAIHDAACAAQPDGALVWGAMAADLRYLPPDRSDVAERLGQWRTVLAAQAGRSAGPAAPAGKDGRLTIGYLAAGAGPAELDMLAQVVAAHDRGRFSVVCFGADDAGSALRGACDRWRNVAPLDNVTLGALVRAEGVGVLVDAVGLAAPARAALLSRRLAPVQVAWLGQPAVGPLPGADLHLAARPGDDRAVLAGGRLLLGGGGLDAGPAPSRQAGMVTLGVEAGPGMISPAMVGQWATVLRASPGVVLAVRDGGWLGDAAAARLADQFGAFGVADRVRVLKCAFAAFVHEVDLLLATYPAVDALALGQALAAGVPVLVRAGSMETDDLAAALAAAGLAADLVADDDRAYIAKAQGLAGDAARLAALRAKGADLVAASPAFSVSAFVGNLERALTAALAEGAKG